jgi:TPR repeat protein
MKAAALLCLALAAAAPGVRAQGASVVIGGMKAMQTEDQLTAASQLCSVRFAATAAAWNEALARFRSANAAALEELRTLRQAVLAAEARRNPAGGERALDIFRTAGMLQVTTVLAAASDEQATRACTAWREGLAEGGAVERGLPNALEAARRFQPAPGAASAAR